MQFTWRWGNCLFVQHSRYIFNLGQAIRRRKRIEDWRWDALLHTVALWKDLQKQSLKLSTGHQTRSNPPLRQGSSSSPNPHGLCSSTMNYFLMYLCQFTLGSSFYKVIFHVHHDPIAQNRESALVYLWPANLKFKKKKKNPIWMFA